MKCKLILLEIVAAFMSAIVLSGCGGPFPFSVKTLWIVKFENAEYTEHIIGADFPIAWRNKLVFELSDTVLTQLSDGYCLYSKEWPVFEGEDVMGDAVRWRVYDLTYEQLMDSLAENPDRVPQMRVIDDNPKFELYVWFHDFVGPYRDIMQEIPNNGGSGLYDVGEFYQLDRTFQDEYANECYASYVDLFKYIIKHRPEDLEKYSLGYVKDGKVKKSWVWDHKKRAKVNN